MAEKKQKESNSPKSCNYKGRKEGRKRARIDKRTPLSFRESGHGMNLTQNTGTTIGSQYRESSLTIQLSFIIILAIECLVRASSSPNTLQKLSIERVSESMLIAQLQHVDNLSVMQ